MLLPLLALLVVWSAGAAADDLRPGGRLDAERRHEYEVSAAGAGGHRQTVSRRGGSYGDRAGKPAVAGITHRHVRIYSMVEFEGSLYALGTGGRTTVVAKLKAGGDPRRAAAYEIIDRIDGEPIPLIHVAQTDGRRLVLTGETRRYVLDAGRWRREATPDPESFTYSANSGEAMGLRGFSFWVPAFVVRRNLVAAGDGPGGRRLFVWNRSVSTNGSGPDEGAGIYEISDAGRVFHRLPAPTYDLFRKLRPARVADGYTYSWTIGSSGSAWSGTRRGAPTRGGS